MALPLAQILEGRRKPICIGSDQTVGEALQVMFGNSFGQLPVVDANNQLQGLISFRTILRTYYHTAGKVELLELSVSNCQEPANMLAPDDDLLQVLNLLRDRQTAAPAAPSGIAAVAGIATGAWITAISRIATVAWVSTVGRVSAGADRLIRRALARVDEALHAPQAPVRA